MAHSPKTKAEALTLLIGGNGVSYVAKMVHVPKQTVSRWRANDLDVLRADRLRANPHLRALAVAIAEAGITSVSRHQKKRRKNGTNAHLENGTKRKKEAK